jgi:molybdopterin converting factor small subunit
MAVVTVRLNGSLSSYSNKKDNLPVSFEGERVKLSKVLSQMALHIPEKAVAFLAINGVKAAEGSWVKDGDVIDIFPVVAGG